MGRRRNGEEEELEGGGIGRSGIVYTLSVEEKKSVELGVRRNMQRCLYVQSTGCGDNGERRRRKSCVDVGMYMY